MSKPKACGYSHTYPLGSSGQFEKIWLEVELQEGDDPRQVLYHCKKTVESFHFESNKAAEKELAAEVLQQDKNGKLTQTERLINLINQCTSIQKPLGLEAYEILAKNNPQIKEAYDKKLKELNG